MAKTNYSSSVLTTLVIFNFSFINIAITFKHAIAGVAIIFSASFGHVKWYDIVCDPGTLCTVSFFMFAAMMIIFLIYEEVARPFSKKAKDNDDHDDHKQKSIVDSVGEYSEED